MGASKERAAHRRSAKDAICSGGMSLFLADTVEKLKSQLTTEFRGAPIEADIW